jgi:hypothetical protein
MPIVRLSHNNDEKKVFFFIRMHPQSVSPLPNAVPSPRVSRRNISVGIQPTPQLFVDWGAALSFVRLVLIGTTHRPSVPYF